MARENGVKTNPLVEVDIRGPAPAPARDNLSPKMPDTNTRWILGTLVLLGGLILQQGAATNTRIDDLRAEMHGGLASVRGEIQGMNDRLQRLQDRLQGLDDRLRAVEVAFGKVEQRLATLERVMLPAPADD